MARTVRRTLRNSQGPCAPQRRGGAWFRALFWLRCRQIPSPRDAALVREDSLGEAAASLSAGDGLAFTGREYRLLELLRRIDP